MLDDVLRDVNELEKIVSEKALQRLEYEGRDKDSAVIDSSGEFYQKPVDYALKLYLFYMCFKCQKPYFAGGYQCQEVCFENSFHNS